MNDSGSSPGLDLCERNIGLLDQMYVILSKVHFDKDVKNKLIWKNNTTDRFLDKSLCGLLSSNPSIDTIFIFAGIWRGIVPSKVKVFCWIAIINKINIRSMLFKRGILDISHKVEAMTDLVGAWSKDLLYSFKIVGDGLIVLVLVV